jgi:hypothetical protein
MEKDVAGKRGKWTHNLSPLRNTGSRETENGRTGYSGNRKWQID